DSVKQIESLEENKLLETKAFETKKKSTNELSMLISGYFVKNFKNIKERKALANAEKGRLLGILTTLDSSLAEDCVKFFENCDNDNIDIIELNLDYLNYFIHYQLIPMIRKSLM
ncbi:27155_t:CDS:1, partial [Dentiscutata erythropus]